jgi:hypothetical protein
MSPTAHVPLALARPSAVQTTCGEDWAELSRSTAVRAADR